MANGNKTISDLSTKQSIQAGDYAPISDGGSDKKFNLGAELSNINSTLANINTAVAGKQATLVSGSNIKTINGVSILGSGDLKTEEAYVLTKLTTDVVEQGGGVKYVPITQEQSDDIVNANFVSLVFRDDYFQSIYFTKSRIYGSLYSIKAQNDSVYNDADTIIASTGLVSGNRVFKWVVKEKAGLVDDVKVDGVSVVTNKIANINGLAKQSDLAETNRVQKLIIQSAIGKLFTFVKRAYTTYKVNIQSGAIATTLEKMSGNSIVVDEEIVSANVDKIVNLGVNQWDEQWENGYINASGRLTDDTASIRSKNYNVCKPNTNYYFFKTSSYANTPNICWYDENKQFISRSGTTPFPLIPSPSNAHYFKITCFGYGSTYNNNISINYPSSNTTYHQYKQLIDITIPQSIQNLEGYGQSNDDVRNIIDFTNKKFYKFGYYDSNDTWVDDEQIIDIANLLEGFNNSFNVEGGGTLEFHNPSNYEVDLPTNFENMEVIE